MFFDEFAFAVGFMLGNKGRFQRSRSQWIIEINLQTPRTDHQQFAWVSPATLLRNDRLATDEVSQNNLLDQWSFQQNKGKFFIPFQIFIVWPSATSINRWSDRKYPRWPMAACRLTTADVGSRIGIADHICRGRSADQWSFCSLTMRQDTFFYGGRVLRPVIGFSRYLVTTVSGWPYTGSDYRFAPMYCLNYNV